MDVTTAATSSERLKSAFESAHDNYTQALGSLDAAAKTGDDNEIFKVKQDLEKHGRIMAAISNISQSIHGLLVSLIDKLNIRS